MPEVGGLQIVERIDLSAPKDTKVADLLDGVTSRVKSIGGQTYDISDYEAHLARAAALAKDINAKICALTLPERPEIYTFAEIAEIRGKAGFEAVRTIEELGAMNQLPLKKKEHYEVGGVQGYRNLIRTYHLFDTQFDTNRGLAYLRIGNDIYWSSIVDNLAVRTVSSIGGMSGGPMNIFLGKVRSK